MKKLLFHLFTLAILTFSFTAKAISGGQFVEYCQSSVTKGICAGYLMGLSDSNVLHQSMKNPTLFCMRDNITNEQKVEIYLRFMNTNPMLKEKYVAEGAISSFIHAFPCN